MIIKRNTRDSNLNCSASSFPQRESSVSFSCFNCFQHEYKVLVWNVKQFLSSDHVKKIPNNSTITAVYFHRIGSVRKVLWRCSFSPLVVIQIKTSQLVPFSAQTEVFEMSGRWKSSHDLW